MDRHPGLKFVCVENEIGWMPFMLQQWDYYWNRFKGENPISINKNPSEYFNDQFYGTFFRDTVAGHNFEWWGQDNCMWSNDYPHANSTWPDSKKYIDRRPGAPAGGHTEEAGLHQRQETLPSRRSRFRAIARKNAKAARLGRLSFSGGNAARWAGHGKRVRREGAD